MTEEAAQQDVSVLYDVSDLRALYRSCKRCRRSLLWVAMIPIVFSTLNYTDGARGVELVYGGLPYALIGVAIVLFIYFLSPVLQVRSRRKNGWGVPMTVQLNADGMATKHPSQDSQFHWAEIKDVVTKNERLFLFTSPGCAIILPRRVFSSDHHFSDWVGKARDYWGKAKPPEASE